MRNIRNSAKALILKDDRLLAVRIRDGGEEWYILPGGGQESEELLPETVLREVMEELGVRVEVGDLVFVVEGRHGEPFHRVDLVFRCAYLGKSDGAERHADAHQAGYDWLDVATLNRAPLYPSKLRRPIMELWRGGHPRVYLGNEEIGDPEIAD